MLYREIIEVYSEIHTKHINSFCGQNAKIYTLNLVVNKVTARFWKVNVSQIKATYSLP
jgi:hypothetical protein